jgi:hypothetical protein
VGYTIACILLKFIKGIQMRKEFSNNNIYNIRILSLLIILVFSSLILFACNWEKTEALPPAPVVKVGDCDTTNVSFKDFVLPTILRDCACHSSQSPTLKDFSSIKSVIGSGNFYNAVYDPASAMGLYFYMDSSLTKRACALLKISSWKNKGMQDN